MTALPLVHDDLALDIPERMIVAPDLGTFAPVDPQVVTTEGEIVLAGQLIGTLTAGDRRTDVRSPFTGFLMGVLAHRGERVRAGQPIAWLRVIESTV